MKTALVLEGGGMRGLYTCGVLDYFMDMNIHFDAVIGVSAGACHACSYVSNQRGRALRTATQWIQDSRYMSLKSLVQTGDLFNAQFVYYDIPNRYDPYDYQAFNQSHTKLYATCTDCYTGKPLYFPIAHMQEDIEFDIPNRYDPYDYQAFNQSHTKLYATCTDCYTGKPLYFPIAHMQEDIEFIRASASLPLVANMVNYHGYTMLDGGIADSIPFEHMMEKGYDKIVVVLTRCKGYQKEANALMPLIRKRYKEYPELIKACENRHIHYNQQLQTLDTLEKKNQVFCIYPSEIHVGRLEKDPKKLKELYHTGYTDIQKQKDALLAYLDIQEELYENA